MDNHEAADVLVGRSARVGVGARLARERLAGGHRPRERLVGRDRATTSTRYPSRCTGSSRTRSSARSGADVRQGLTTLVRRTRSSTTSSRPRCSDARSPSRSAPQRSMSASSSSVDRISTFIRSRASFLEERSAQLGLVAGRERRLTLSGHLPESSRVGRRVRADRADGHDRRARGSHAPRPRRAARHGATLDARRSGVTLAAQSGLDAPIFALARAETVLRNGQARRSDRPRRERPQRANRCSSSARCRWPDGPRTSRRERRTRCSLYERAEAGGVVRSRDPRREVGPACMCSIDLELPDAEAMLVDQLVGRRRLR